eukprot:TRINITY_DN446_c0_g1_i1.p1 TRINITY_DN446_c0_g1~~TRINITY_DN446_c0_g1_i1.p1  ORF type:complete len:111 (+),score=30.65 TRINITY_DN446_c0_g1_i1:158-490(+)
MPVSQREKLLQLESEIQLAAKDLQTFFMEFESGSVPLQEQKERERAIFRVKTYNEALMRILFKLDGVTFDDDSEGKEENKALRKRLVNEVHSLHEQADNVILTIQQLSTS